MNKLAYLFACALAAVSGCRSIGGIDDTEVDDGGALDASTPDAPGLQPDCTPTPGLDFAVEEVAAGLADPLYLTSPKNDPRLFILEQPGRIRIVKDGELVAAPFLDLVSIVRSTGNEQGLLGLAFHPQFATNGRFFVNYTANDPAGATVVAEYRAAPDADVADPEVAERRLLEIPQFAANHNGGMIEFGPDGFLYIGMGDGGNAGDPEENGQDAATLLAAMLRIDVDGGDPYGIPASNPFANSPNGPNDPRPEIWAIGLRNPWRWSFDRMTGDLWIGDVGQNAREEIDFQPASSTGGENYGWDEMEGTLCFEPSQGCDMVGKVMPIIEYDHQGICTSVTGGYVYRGTCLPDLQGQYIYADFCFDEIYRYNPDDDTQVEFNTFGATQVSSFGEDATGELYIVSRAGSVFRLVASAQ